MVKKDETLQAFLDDATLLIKACPTTTRLTLKYKLPKNADGTTITANLVAKAFDPVGGVCLKYETNRAVEVGRLILGFQELGQVMANVPTTEVKTEESVGDGDIKAEAMLVDEPATGLQPVKIEGVAGRVDGGGQTSQSTAGGGKKKKKAKR